MAEQTIRVLGGLWEIPDIPPEAASEFVKLPSLADRLRKYAGSACNLPTAEGLADLRQMIEQHAELIAEKLSRDQKGGWYRVKVKNGKNDDPAAKNVKCSISCRYDDGMMPCAEVQLHVATFWAPRSRLHEEALDCYCPAWVVHKGLEETKRRSRFRRMNKITRTPAEAPCWPPGLKAKWIRLHLERLPTPEALEEARELNAAVWKAKTRQSEERDRPARLAREEAAKAAQLATAKARAQKEKRREEMECRKSVNIRWKEWTRKGGRYVAESCEADGVDLYFSGDRTYIVFPDGDELIKKASSVEILGAAEEVTETTSEPIPDATPEEAAEISPFGLKEDGTPRKAKAGPGRPRVYSTEEASERRRKCRERWKEENKEKMREYRKAWRERQKTK